MSRNKKMLTITSALWLIFGVSSAVALDPLKAEHNWPDVGLSPETFGAVVNFSTFLLDRSSGLLFIGARDAILSVDTNRMDMPPRLITWDVPEEQRALCLMKGKEETECHNYIRLLEFLGEGRIYACGTFAFNPTCAFLSMSDFALEKTEDGVLKTETGQHKCPFDPHHRFTAVTEGGILYSGVSRNFRGTQFVISRATGPADQRVQTEESYLWLDEPEFVGSAFIQEPVDNNPTGEDDKIFFFFTEVAKEYQFYTKVKVPRVARICRSDLGGQYIMQRRWTTFLKAQLVCEDKARDRRYNLLTDVFTMEHVAGDPHTTHFYGLFTSQWEPEFSAVCVFSLSDIVEVMDGPFTELTRNGKTWLNPGTVPKPRPGQCLNNALRAQGINSSLDLPGPVLNFKRSHNLMENSATAAPLLARKGTTYTKLAASQMEGEPGGVLLHLGTDRGELHQVLVVGYKATLLREIPLFESDEPVNSVILHEGQALVGSPMSLARVQASGCSLFPNCELCARASALGCEWMAPEKACRSAPAEPGPGNRTSEDALAKCGEQEGRCSPPTQRLKVSLGLRLLLPCQRLSTRPCSWEHPPHRHTRQVFSGLEVTVANESLGRYVCTCEEVGPDGRDLAPCLTAIYDLKLMSPNNREIKARDLTPCRRAVVSGRKFCLNSTALRAMYLTPRRSVDKNLKLSPKNGGEKARASGHNALTFSFLYLCYLGATGGLVTTL